MFPNQLTFSMACLYILQRLSDLELATSEICGRLRVMILVVPQLIGLYGRTLHQNFQWSRFVPQLDSTGFVYNILLRKEDSSVLDHRYRH